jgi:hypothetical protein
MVVYLQFIPGLWIRIDFMIQIRIRIHKFIESLSQALSAFPRRTGGGCRAGRQVIWLADQATPPILPSPS